MIPSRKHRRTLSSQRWLSRQHTDPYVQKARRYGYRSRSAFKLLEMDAKYKFLKPGLCVLDLGCAPGGWSQVVVRRVRVGHVVGVDRVPLKPINRVFFVQGDVTEEVTKKTLFEALSGRADVVLSDMAPLCHGTQSHRQKPWRSFGVFGSKICLCAFGQRFFLSKAGKDLSFIPSYRSILALF